ncbi:hypothetical protein [Nocardia brasiliensis]|uniref:hypothetical protein n=1 Tax=Nocardia brasiliensis TaxID=37326 RepID=UPI0004A6CA4B|nr:hypothetical protein [Nocardia brasiliensis]
MTSEPALFDLPAGTRPAEPTAEELTRGQKRARLVERRIACGAHPLGNLALHPEAARGREGDGLRCGSCRFRVLTTHHGRTYPKCMFGEGIRVSACESSDIRAWWPACRDYEPEGRV